jgi:hypothetical protein
MKLTDSQIFIALVEKFGSKAAASRALGLPVNTFQTWMMRRKEFRVLAVREKALALVQGRGWPNTVH